RVKTANQRDKNFGDAVAALGDHFQFSDPGVMRTSYASSSGMTWTEQLSELRGAAVHEGAFDFQSGRHDLLEVVALSDHLHDLLLRLLLRILGSQAEYNSPIFPSGMLRGLNWVEPATSIDELIARK